MESLSVGNGERRSAEMPVEQTPQVPARNAEAVRELLDGSIIKCAVRNQSQTTPNGGRSAAPGRRAGGTFGAAAQARAKSGFSCGCRARIECNVFGFRRDGRANRPAIDAGRFDADKELAVKPRIAGQAGAFVYFVLLHAASIRPGEGETSRNRTYTSRSLAQPYLSMPPRHMYLISR